ncbi:MAG: hypothetical protein ACK4IT_01580 [Thioalkalivibrionaceae bacterium]
MNDRATSLHASGAHDNDASGQLRSLGAFESNAEQVAAIGSRQHGLTQLRVDQLPAALAQQLSSSGWCIVATESTDVRDALHVLGILQAVSRSENVARGLSGPTASTQGLPTTIPQNRAASSEPSTRDDMATAHIDTPQTQLSHAVIAQSSERHADDDALRHDRWVWVWRMAHHENRSTWMTLRAATALGFPFIVRADGLAGGIPDWRASLAMRQTTSAAAQAPAPHCDRETAPDAVLGAELNSGTVVPAGPLK